MITKDLFLEAMRRNISGVSVVTSDGIGGRMGLTVSSYASISADPAIIMIAINHKGPMSEIIQENRGFCVNLLSQSQQIIANQFAGRAENPQDNYQFDPQYWQFDQYPIIKNGLCSLVAKTITMSNVGSHHVFLGAVGQIHLGIEGPPLAYCNRNYLNLAQ